MMVSNKKGCTIDAANLSYHTISAVAKTNKITPYLIYAAALSNRPIRCAEPPLLA